MPILSAPLVLGQMGQAVTELHELIFWFLNNNHLDTSGEQDPDQLMQLNEERAAARFGNATAYFVIKIHSVVGGWEGDPRQISDSAVIAIENFVSAHSEPETEGYKVYGRVINENGVGVPDVNVIVLLKTLRNEREAATARSDAKGYYTAEIASVSDPAGSTVKTALKLRATSATGATIDSPLISNVGKTTNVDLILPIANNSAMESEFQVIESKISEAVGQAQLSTLTHKDLGFLKSINENENLLLTYLYAVEYAGKTGNAIEAQVFYGLLRTNGIAPHQAIFNWSKDQVESLLSKAVASNYIPFKETSQIGSASSTIKSTAASLITQSIGQPASDASTIKILKTALNDAQINDFLSYYNSGDTLNETFWKDQNLTSAIPGSSTATIYNLKKVLEHAINTGNNPALVRHIMNIGLVNTVSQSEQQWKSQLQQLINLEDFVIPATIEGSNTEERLTNYARSLFTIYSNSYKTEYAQAKITETSSAAFPVLKANLESFASANPSFDILRTPVAKLSDGTYNLSLNLSEAFIQEVSKVQRLNALTNNFDSVKEIAVTPIDPTDSGSATISSATDIIKMTQSGFQQAFSAKLGGDAKALAVYDKALSVDMTSQLLALEAYQAVQADFPVIYNFPSSNPNATQLEWRSLFGSVDYCTCEHCSSVFSPAAYFVDCMELLRRFDAPTFTQLTTTPAYNWLKTKRLDLWDLKLTCKNTNTSIPAIDIVNETLEAIIGTAPTADPSLGNLITAKNTIADARLNRAIPEYINSAGADTPYRKLLLTKYPWSAPYNYYADQCKAYFKIIDLKPYQIAQAFSKEDHPKTLGSGALAGAYLGITGGSTASNSDLSILEDVDTTNLPEYYGFKEANGAAKTTLVNPADRTKTLPVSNSGNLQNGLLEKVNVFLQQTQLTFQDLLELLDCYYVNPAVGLGSTAVRKLQIKGTPETTCDTDKLIIEVQQVTGNFTDYKFAAHFLFNSMRIVRLSKKTGLSKYEVDKILTAYGLVYNQPIDDNVIIYIAQVLRTKEILNATLEEVLSFWADFPHRLYNDYSGDRPQPIPTLYERLFRNQSVVPDFEKITDYPFKPLSLYGQWLSLPALPSYEKMRSWVLAIFKLTTRDLEYLIKNFYGDVELFPGTASAGIVSAGEFIFSHDNILKLYREITLARFLNLSIPKWVAYRRWIFRQQAPKEPLGTAPILDAALLLGFVEKIKVFEQQDLPFEGMQYAFWDGFSELPEKEVRRNLLIGQLSGLRDILSRVHLDYEDKGTSVISSKKLQDLLLSLVDPQDADFLVNGVALRDTLVFTPEETQYFDSLLPAVLSPSNKEKLFGGSTSPSTNKQERLQVLVDSFLPTLKEQANRKELVSYLSAQNNISTEFTDLLLSDNIKIAGKNGFEILMREPFVRSKEPITLASVKEPNAPSSLKFFEPFLVLEKLHKIAQTLNSFNLSIAEFEVFKPYCELVIAGVTTNFLSNPKVGNLLENNVVPWPDSLDATYNFIAWMNIRNAFMPTPLGLYYVLSETAKALGGGKKGTWVTAVSKSLQIAESEIETLVGTNALDFDFSAELQPFQYSKLFAALDMMKWLEASASMGAEIAAAVLEPDTQAKADKIVQVVRARYGKTEWLDVIQPVSDVLRVNRRDAMVAYLLAYPPAGYEKRWISELDLFETLLIDTQVMPVVQTSRIRQAISSLQLFFDRCILQREVSLAGNMVVLGGEAIRQWNLWRKWYRVWEANRKVFVYPENWIEPELRDDKSPFFKDLEKFVNQNDITLETMEDAYKGYLERLDEVAFLNIIGYYTEDIKTDNGTVLDSVVHTFGRTRSYPYLYHYRKRVNNVWSAWEKMEAQIDGDHFVPVMWRGRLRLYWVTFLDKIIPEPKKLKMDEEQRTPLLKHEIMLHWTEYKNGKWTPSQLGNQNAVLSFGGEAPRASTAEELKYHIARPMTKPDDWANTGMAHTPKSYEREIGRMKERLLLYAVIKEDGQLYIECDTYMEGLTYKEYRRFLFVTYETGYGRAEVDENNWFGNQYITPKLIGQYNNGYATTRDIVDALNWNTDWFTERLDSFYENKNENNAPLKRAVRRPCFIIKHHNVEVSEWETYTQYNSYIDNAATLFGHKNNVYVYPRNKNGANGYDHIVSVSTNLSGLETMGRLKLLNKAPDFDSAPVKEKYIILQKQYPSGLKPVQISRFFYQDYQNLFFVEKDTSNSAVAVRSDLDAVTTRRLTGLTLNVDRIAIEDTSSVLQVNDTTVVNQFTFNTPPAYRFQSFYHYRVNDLLEKRSTSGIKGLFKWAFTVLGQADKMAFGATYQPTGAVVATSNNRDLYPNDTVDFLIDAPTAIYNWELFFHIPMFIANKLMQEQRFMDAMDWYHLVFNPTNQADPDHGGGTSARFWQFYPFFQHSQAGIPSIGDIMANPNLPVAVQQWARDPFKPHLIARNRTGAYMRNVVMKYLDNLIAWGDNLFRRDTMESVNEATMLYVLAAQILGKKPVRIPARLTPAQIGYEDMLGSNSQMNAFSNALVPIQTYLATTSAPVPNAATLRIAYFCIPPNDKLLSYWDVVADRLHKIRNSQSIDGVERQLALFEPPIDPAMLVRAAAAGLSVADAVAELYAPLPAYRFPTMVQKATELAQEVKSLGSALLAAIEKRDAEQLALLRSVQEQKVLEAAKEARTLQIQEAQAQTAALQEQKELILERIKHYQRLVDKGLNKEEEAQLDSLQKSIPLKAAQGDLSTLSSVFYALPSFNLQAPFAIGPSFGGPNLGSIVNAQAASIGVAATVNDIKGSMAGIKASYVRRREEWDMQLKLANREIKQIEKQILAAEIRESIAMKELRVQEIQIQNARDMDLAMHDKYSNEDLYNWMISEISYTYFQSYKLAFDIARKAERCYRYELGVEPVKDFIQFGYWNSLKKGLLAADNLLFDVKRLEMAYLEQNVRYHEMSKSISLAAVDPVALLNLRATGGANIALPEWLFDRDYPGHYFRRIKSVSISIPCVAGPYTTVAAKLTLISSKYRKNALSGASGSGYTEGETDTRFNYLFNGGQSIATSSAQNDSGMFELNFRDERYLPFEGCGAVSTWKLDLPSVYANYDRATISDVIIHVNYTARFDGGLATGAKAALNTLMQDDNATGTPQGIPPYHLISLKHEFSTEWYAAFQITVPLPTPGNVGRLLSVVLHKNNFPIGVQGKNLTITGLRLISRTDSTVAFNFSINSTLSGLVVKTVDSQAPVMAFSGAVTDSQPLNLNVLLSKADGSPMAETDLDDLYLLIEYKTA